MTEGLSPFGRTVKTWRERQGKSRSELAQESGLSYPYVSQLETGIRKPSREAARKIAAALGLSVEDLERTIPSDPRSAQEIRSAEAQSDLILSGHAEEPRLDALRVDSGPPPSSSTSRPGSRADLIGDMIDLLEEFAPEERIEVLAEVQRLAMKRMLKPSND